MPQPVTCSYASLRWTARVDLQELAQFLRAQIRLPQDRSKRPDRQVAITVDRYNDESRFARTSQIMVAPPHMGLPEPCPLQRSNEPSRAPAAVL